MSEIVKLFVLGMSGVFLSMTLLFLMIHLNRKIAGFFEKTGS